MNGKIFTLRNLYQSGTEKLEKAGIREAKLDAWYLLEYKTGISRAVFFADPDREVEEEKAESYQKDICTRARRIPLQHITGEQEFMGLNFKVNENVLVPRQDTETLVEKALEILENQEKPRILDMCTGSGCILLSLLAMKEGASGTGADISPLALKVAKQNAKGLNVADRAEFVESDLFLSPFFAETTGKALPVYDILISNPPYIRSAVIEDLMEEVKGHDPRIALDGHEDGLYFYRRIVSEGSAYVKENGWMLFEIGYDQGEDVSKLLEKAGFRQVQVIQDLAGLDRVVIGQKPHR